MNTSHAKMWVFVGEHFACVKISGRANFSSSIDFRTLVEELRQKGLAYFVLDLSECTLMDSTFLGVLAGIGLKATAATNDHENAAIELLNPNERIIELLENLGVLHLFKLNQASTRVCDETQSRPLTPACPTKEQITRACLEAHQTLMEMNAQNAAKFKEVAAFLAEDLKRAKPGP